MSEDNKKYQLLKVAKEFNVSIATIANFLTAKGHSVEARPNTKIGDDLYKLLLGEYQSDKIVKEEATQIHIGRTRREDVSIDEAKASQQDQSDLDQDEILIKNATSTPISAPEKPEIKEKKEETVDEETKKPTEQEEAKSTNGPKVIGKIDLDKFAPRSKDTKKEKPAAETPTKQEPASKPIEEEKEKPAETPQKAEEPIEKEEVKAEQKSEVEKVEEKKAEKPAEPTEKKPEEAPAKQPEAKQETKEPEKAPVKEDTVIRAMASKLSGPKIIGKIELPAEKAKKAKPVASSSGQPDKQKRKRKRRDNKPGTNPVKTDAARQPRPDQKGKDTRNKPKAKGTREEIDEKKIQEQIKQTLARLSGAGKSGKFADRARFRRQKRDDVARATEEQELEKQAQSRVLQVTEFLTANELANMMDVQVTNIISACMSLGLFVSINQRLDAETIAIVSEEFGYQIEFITTEDQTEVVEIEDAPEDMQPRHPIVTVMGHVDHGKTSLLDHVRKENVIAGEAGGITQHMGAYEVELDGGRKITFLDTPGHEAFTAMRARGAKITDVAIIVIAADDSVMPQTVEAINHAQAAAVPMVFAFNKMDRPGASSDKIKEQLANMNILVEDWGGKFQAQEISAKTGMGIEDLLEKVLLEAELLDLKANPNRRAAGTVIEAAMEKGRGLVSTVLIQAGTLKVGDDILAGQYYGRVKALFNERNQKVQNAGPATPVKVLGMQGAPQAGDRFNALESEHEAKEIATKRQQLQREQGLRTQKHITLDEIGRRLAIGNFKELNLIVKGDVDGSVEALADSLLKQSTEQVQVNVIHKSVGQISESDVLLASASDAIIVGFQVRPSPQARRLAENEQIDIRLYSVIYKAIEEIKAAMEGMLTPDTEEKIVCNVEIREVFKITKVGTIAGCMVLDGKITRNTNVRIVRDGVVVYTGELASLKRYKDDVKEVSAGYECGLNIQNFNDIKEGDIIEGYEIVEVKRKL